MKAWYTLLAHAQEFNIQFSEMMSHCLLDAVHTYFCNGTVRTATSARTELLLPQVLEFAKSAGISRWTSKLSACSRVMVAKPAAQISYVSRR